MKFKFSKKLFLPLSVLIIILTVTFFTLYKNHRLSKENISEDCKKFDTLTSYLFNSSLMDNSVNLHALISDPAAYGLDNVPVTLGSLSVDEFKKYNQSLCDVLQQLNAINPDRLTSDRLLTYNILKTRYTDTLMYCDYYLLDEYLGSNSGQQNLLPVYLAEYSFGSEKDIKDYLEILRLSPDFFDSILEFEKVKADSGTFMNEFQADNVINQCSEFLSDTANHYLIQTFNERIDRTDLSEESKDSYKSLNIEYLNTYFFPSYRKISDTMRELKQYSKNAGGLCNYENGKVYYEGLVRAKTGSAKNVTEIQQMLENALAQDIIKIHDIYSSDNSVENRIRDFSSSYADTGSIIENLYNDIQVYFPAPAVTHKDVTIHEVPKSMENHEAPAYYLSPPIDCITRNSVYINNLYYKDATPDRLIPVLAHEGFPGHLYQTTYFRNTSPDNIRLIQSFPGYSEGWATYAETYSYGLAGLDNAAAEYSSAFTTLSLELYSLFDIYTNYQGYTLEQLMEYGSSWGLDKSQCIKIYHAVIESPCDYLQYSVGYLEILELRNTAMEQLGDTFCIKDFHKFLLDTGPAQFEIIRDEMLNLINTKSGRSKPARLYT